MAGGDASPARRSPARTLSPSSQAAVSEDALARFSDLCRAAYFDRDASAIALVDATVRQQPLSMRASYTKAQSAVRAEFHAKVEQERQAELARVLAETLPNGLLSVVGTSTEALRSSAARRERQRALRRFLDSHAVKSMPGTVPFLRSLHAMLRLQCTPVLQGGAGKRLTQWDVDDAVFMESSGQDFLRDAVHLLKGILGMDEHLREAGPVSWAATEEDDGDVEEEEPMSAASPAQEKPLITYDTTALTSDARSRSGSDPFADVPSSSSSPASSRPQTAVRRPSQTALPPVTRLRTFSMAPHLVDTELEDLADLFPQWLVRAANGKSLEEGTGGHGTLRIGQKLRDPGYEATLIDRLVHWLRRVLHL